MQPLFDTPPSFNVATVNKLDSYLAQTYNANLQQFLACLCGGGDISLNQKNNPGGIGVRPPPISFVLLLLSYIV